MRNRVSERIGLLAVVAGSHLAACSSNSGGTEIAADSGSDGAMASAAGVDGGSFSFNQCGVAAPLPADTGQCTAVHAPLIANFDDYGGAAANSYTFYVNGKPPAPDAVLGAVLHVGDGSDMNGGTGIIATQMVPGEGGAGYALQISDSNASHWGGLLMFYFPSSSASAACLDAHAYAGVEFSLQGTSPSGRVAVTLGMLDTIQKSDHGLCDNPNASDCKDATIQLALPSDATTFAKIQLPWSAFTPGVGSALTCVPVTGQNIVRLVIQPLMNYPPPNYMFAPGAYSIAVDGLQFY